MQSKIAQLTFLSSLLFLGILAPCKTAVLGYNFSIQEEINKANPGDVIYVPVGTYYGPVIVNKSVTLVGENPLTTFVDGGGVGTVVTINASNAEVRGFTIKNGQKVFPWCGVSVWTCVGVTINNSVIEDNFCGIELKNSNSCKIICNTIKNNGWRGVSVSGNDNKIYGNTISNNSIGVSISAPVTPPNNFYCNNFINNTTLQAEGSAKWDNGAEGNYWSDYMGKDLDRDGVGDTEIPHLGVDSYPLIGLVKVFDVGAWDGVSRAVYVASNSTVSNFQLNATEKVISFNVSGLGDTMGFCRVTIPNVIVEGMWNNNYTILVDEELPLDTRNWTDNTSTYMYFVYQHSEHEVIIIPEFSQAIILLLSITSAILKVVFAKRMFREKT